MQAGQLAFGVWALVPAPFLIACRRLVAFLVVLAGATLAGATLGRSTDAYLEAEAINCIIVCAAILVLALAFVVADKSGRTGVLPPIAAPDHDN